MPELHPYLHCVTVGQGNYRGPVKMSDYVKPGALSWLGEPMTDAQAARYEAHRQAVIEANREGDAQ